MSIQLLPTRLLRLLDIGPLELQRRRQTPKTWLKTPPLDLTAHLHDVAAASASVNGAIVPFESVVTALGGKSMKSMEERCDNLPRAAALISMAKTIHISKLEDLEVLQQLRSTPTYLKLHSFTFDVPAGEVCSRMIYNKEWEAAQVESADIASWPEEHSGGVPSLVPMKGIAILRSALTCRYEGLHIPPTRTVDETMRLLSLGCDSVIWEEGSCGLTPRVLENFIKAAASCGVPLSRVSLMLKSNEEVTANCVARALEGGIDNFCGSSLNTARLPLQDQVATLDELLRTAVHLMDETGDLPEGAVAALEQLEEACNRLAAD